MPFDAKGGAEKAGGGAKGIVTKKIGPLPLWAYVVGGAAAVFLLTRGKGGSSTSPAGSGIKIPTFTPGSSSDGGISSGGNAVGSPGQNIQGGSDTQPAGAKPWWTEPPAWWMTSSPAKTVTVSDNPTIASGTNPGKASAGGGAPQYGPGPNGAPFIPAWQFPGGTYPKGVDQWGPIANRVTQTSPKERPDY